MTPNVTPQNVSFSFDIGHASIGWAAFDSNANSAIPEVLGCGVLLFPKEDCQNHLRAGFRRQRRHIAATRNRIARISKLLVSIGALTESDATKQAAVSSGIMMPWLLAARALHGGERGKLSWMELWQVLRWYAHNRGYDGNARWAEAKSEDTEKVQNANALMEKHGTKSMAETICAFLDVKIDDSIPYIGEKAPYFKGSNVAFPREVVRSEVEKVVRAQFKHLKGCNEAFLSLLMGRDLTRDEKRSFKLPERYAGGLLFGQMIPRFDNRIIPHCPISGEKTPAKHCTDYYRFRWAMLVANMVVDDAILGRRVLTPKERVELTRRMQDAGGMSKIELRKTLEEITGSEAKALDDQFFSPEAEKALVLDPVRDKLHSAIFASVWPLATEMVQRRMAGEYFKRGRLSLAQILAAMKKAGVDTTEAEKTIRLDFAKAATRKRKEPLTYEDYVGKAVAIDSASGRAPYSRTLLRKAFDEVMVGMHPSSIADSQPQTASERRNGCIAFTEEVYDRVANEKLDDHTNNHLVRQRIRMFQLLFKDMYKLYAGGDVKRVKDVTIEVARDLQEYAGKNAKEKAQVFSEKAKPFQRAEAKLKKDFEEAGIKTRISYRMIRKARIAMAQDWTCPYTGRRFTAAHIADDRVDFEHIIPYADRQSDALEGLAITFREVNKMKGKRAALEFIRECQNMPVSITGEANSMIWTESLFKNFVDGLYPHMRPGKNASDEDRLRWRRKEWLLKEDYDERNAEFTHSALSVTSHLNKLAALEARKFLRSEAAKFTEEKVDNLGKSPEYRVGHMQGRITSEFRKGWNLMGCLAPVCPEVIDEADPEKRIFPKGEIRNITHLHHALDAVTIGIANHVCRGRDEMREVGEAIIARSPTPQQRKILEGLGIFIFDANGKHHLKDLTVDVLENIENRLGEYRVIQHVPHSMHGLRAEQTQWRVLHTDAEKDRVLLSQYGPRDPKNGNVRKKKHQYENSDKLLGYMPSGNSKLKPNKAVIVISDNFGIAMSKEPKIIRHINVWRQLTELSGQNGNHMPEVLRNGHLIKVPKGDFIGVWCIKSTKKDASKGILVDISRPHIASEKPEKRDVRLRTLIKAGMTILHPSTVG